MQLRAGTLITVITLDGPTATGREQTHRLGDKGQPQTRRAGAGSDLGPGLDHEQHPVPAGE
jgi:hypothetical protein